MLVEAVTMECGRGPIVHALVRFPERLAAVLANLFHANLALHLRQDAQVFREIDIAKDVRRLHAGLADEYVRHAIQHTLAAQGDDLEFLAPAIQADGRFGEIKIAAALAAIALQIRGLPIFRNDQQVRMEECDVGFRGFFCFFILRHEDTLRKIP